MNKLFQNLKEENKKLRRYVDTKLGHSNVQELLTEKRAEAKIQDARMATQNFISALRNPANRIVDCDMMKRKEEYVEIAEACERMASGA